ncbi:Dehydrodolichyl diphosphate synthase complex subunit DHDDS [Porphyridium purpureum]|uniref:Alkyl transferase n=1 Tax=Porphyridium purpureum TaxID=35688 RepID=A0A5J4YUV8_PORPP|nr:Dehydrodolichyl diphosphate synthase complex subunit DHDDS [Porphyridium purpureum]|eukprot:POR9900..scf229_5
MVMMLLTMIVGVAVVAAVALWLAPRSRPIRRGVFAVLRWCGPGPLPRHVAFVMDGNRRWARQLGMPGSDGHPKGSDKLMDALEWCHDAQVEQVTVYAFSLENFKRSQHEVDSIMQLAKQKFTEMLNREDVVHKYRFRVRVLGERHLLDPQLQSVMNSAELATAQYDERVLNICFAYTSRAEIAAALLDQARAMQQDTQFECTERTVEHSLMTGASFPDLLIRTSGENRLSDFLLWQSMFAHIVFMHALWPNLSVWHFVRAIMSYQASASSIARARRMHNTALHHHCSSAATLTSDVPGCNQHLPAVCG